MSTASDSQPPYRHRPISHFLQARWRLMFAILFSAAVFAVLSDGFLLVTRFLISWDAGVALYLVLVTVMISRSDTDRMRRESVLQDQGRITIPVLTVAAGLASLGAIIFWLRAASAIGSDHLLYLALMFVTTLLSWIFIHTMFALHYAHEYYAEHRGPCGGMRFPDQIEPDYWDFVYFSFVMGTSTAVSDVAITSRTIRRTATAHGLVAFIFNVTMIALTVSIAGDAASMN